MRVTFDSNVWEHIVRPHAHENSPHHAELEIIHEAIRSGRVHAFLSETFATVEAIKRRARFQYLEGRPIPVQIEWEEASGRHVQGQIRIAADPNDHPGLAPILRDLLGEAFALGFKILPSSRLGTLRPPELEPAENKIPLTAEQQDNVWPLLDRIDNACRAIESRGVGMTPLVNIASRIQDRLGIRDAVWYDGLNQARDDNERREIADAFSEWADGDSVALHVGYGLDVFCTNDRARPGRPSVFDNANRTWLTETFAVRFMTLTELAEAIRP